MTAISELRSLTAAERLQLVEDLWNSIVEDHELLPDSPAVITDVRLRKALFMAHPASGASWEEAKARIRSDPFSLLLECRVGPRHIRASRCLDW